MKFEIPKEHTDTPEAKRLLEIDAEFTAVCALQHKAIITKQYQSDPAAFEALDKQSRALRQALNDAELAYDQATGEPKPVNLSPDVVQEIERQFAANDGAEVIAKLAKTLGYLRRQRVEDNRIAKYVLLLAKGNKEQVAYFADAATNDFRDIIFWVENAEEARLNTPAKIEDLQKTLERLGLDRKPELEREKQRIIEENVTNTQN